MRGLGRERLRDHHHRGADAGAGQADGQTRLRRGRDVHDLGGAGALGEARSPRTGPAHPALDQGEAGVCGRPRREVGLDLERAVLAREQQAAAAALAQLEHERGGGPDGRVEVLGRPGSAGVDHDQRAAVGVGAQPALEQPGPARQRGPVDARRRRAVPVGPKPVDLGRAQRLDGRRAGRAAPLLPRARDPPDALGARQHEDFLGGRRADTHHPGELERVGHDQRRRVDPAHAAAREAGDDANAGRAPARDQRHRGVDRHRLAGQRVEHRRARQAPGTAADLDRRLDRLVLDDSLGLEVAFDARRTGGQLDPRGPGHGQHDERDARHEQRGGVEQQRDQDQREPGDPDRRRTPHR